ncbi:non-ribosomal peptide synthetase [Burkholderia sp.]|uniref:non-ribosomal peptide synthetase n=1 Tax=Burkholderia sp. TaxID=36773 RepID=UPI00258EE161|nr:non-ribosomal peptide synthetase [Burkholderia sp.]MCA3931536.1 non-ribosomal peptide synthetase [Burkholderia sp.]
MSTLLGESFAVPQSCLHELFEHVAARHPQRIALEQDEQQLTYDALNRASNRLAHWLRDHDVRRGDLVALCASSSFDMLTALLAVQKAGAAYVPIDPAYSTARIRQILDVTPLKIALIDTAQVPAEIVETCESRVQARSLSHAIDDAGSMSDVNPGVQGLLQQAAYVIFTSGSTGKPKGVMVPHRGAANLVAAMVRHWPITEASRMLQFASLGFDASVPEWAGPLSVGGTVVLKPRDALVLGDDLIEMVKRKRVTIFKMPASALRVLTRQSLPEVRTIVTAGDACTPELVAYWAREHRFFNCYGPTEVSIGSTMARLQPEQDIVTIGRPNANLRGYVLNEQLQPVAAGEVGELYMAGIGVTWGYLGQAGMTAGRFLPDPEGEAGARMYRTGDCVRLLPDGELQFLGRIDEQVKIRGFRVELNEIEETLLRLDGIEQAAVIALSEGGDEQILVGFVCGDRSWTVERLREALGQELPTYMVPARWYRLPQMPLTINRKVDREALSACPGERIHAEGDALDLDANALEQAVAAVWSQHLEGPVSLTVPLTAMGGDSLLAVRISQQLREQLGLSFSPADVIQASGIRALLQAGQLVADTEDLLDIDAMDEEALDRIIAELDDTQNEHR